MEFLSLSKLEWGVLFVAFGIGVFVYSLLTAKRKPKKNYSEDLVPIESEGDNSTSLTPRARSRMEREYAEESTTITNKRNNESMGGLRAKLESWREHKLTEHEISLAAHIKALADTYREQDTLYRLPEVLDMEHAERTAEHRARLARARNWERAYNEPEKHNRLEHKEGMDILRVSGKYGEVEAEINRADKLKAIDRTHEDEQYGIKIKRAEEMAVAKMRIKQREEARKADPSKPIELIRDNGTSKYAPAESET